MDYSMLIGLENKNLETPKDILYSTDNVRSHSHSINSY